MLAADVLPEGKCCHVVRPRRPLVVVVQPSAPSSKPKGPLSVAPAGAGGFVGSGRGVIGQPPVVPGNGWSKQ